jgi:hypothetical protein
VIGFIIILDAIYSNDLYHAHKYTTMGTWLVRIKVGNNGLWSNMRKIGDQRSHRLNYLNVCLSSRLN